MKILNIFKMKQKLKVTDKEMKKYDKQLHNILKKNKFIPDRIIAISRGGLYPGLLLSHILGVDLAVLAIQSYDDTIQNKIESNWHIATSKKFKSSDKILIIDDISDSGKTQYEVEQFMEKAMPHHKCKFATIFYKSTKKKKVTIPDYVVVGTNKWVVFPWEKE